MYFITCMTKCEEVNGWFYGGTTRCFGYTVSFEEAEEILNNNICDLYECCYEYAVVEKLGPYIHPHVEEEYWFKWNEEKGGFFRINKPEVTYHVCNHALG